MQFRTFFAIIALTLASVAESATIVVRAPTVVWSPTILSPHASSIWKSGTRVNVTWSTANAPAVISNLGKVILHGGPASVNKQLSTNFDLKRGWVTVHVPFVVSSHDYTITLFGDSNNISPRFKILDGHTGV